MTKRAHAFGSGFLFLISYLLYEDDDGNSREEAIGESCFGFGSAPVLSDSDAKQKLMTAKFGRYIIINDNCWFS